MLKKILSIFIFTFLSIHLFSNTVFDEGVKYYMSKQYEKSIASFQSLVNEGYQSHSLYYNLACAYFKMEDYAHAMLWFERAKRLNPSDDDTEFNIQVTKYKLKDKIEALPELFFITWWKSFLNIFSEKQWSVITIILFFVFFILLAIFLITPVFWLRKTSFYVGIFTISAFIISFLAAYSQTKIMNNKHEAIIMSKKMEIKSSPDAASKVLFVVHDGVKVNIQDKIGEWVEIKLPNGDKGWVLMSELEVV